MPERLFRLYQRKRVININVNMLVAGLIAIALAKYPVKWISDAIGPERTIIITLIAYALDALLDVVVYFGLHWVANHWRPVKPRTEKDRRHHAAPKPNYIADVGRVQAERIALVPLFAAIAMGGMWALQHFAQMSASWAFVVAYVSAIVTTRVVHTLWGLRSGTLVDHHKRANGQAPDGSVDGPSHESSPDRAA